MHSPVPELSSLAQKTELIPFSNDHDAKTFQPPDRVLGVLTEKGVKEDGFSICESGDEKSPVGIALRAWNSQHGIASI
jgi:hypothetical protein